MTGNRTTFPNRAARRRQLPALRRLGSAVLTLAVAAVCIAGARVAEAQDTPLPKLESGDRVVFVGNTLIERAQHYDFIELAMTTRFPGVTYRNLGWSGDTVYGESRAYFGTPEDGFNHLKRYVQASEPTVILVGYGLNESYRGEEGVKDFEQGLDRLLNMLEETGARIVLLSPLPHEQATSPLPDVSPANANVQLYSRTIGEVAETRGHGYVDLFTLMRELEPQPDQPLTSNGIHLTAFGYYHLAGALEHGLGWPTRQWVVHVNASAGRVQQEQGVDVEDVTKAENGIRFTATDDRLPLDMPGDVQATSSNYLPPRTLRVSGLGSGRYRLTIDGEGVAQADARDWARGVTLHQGPPFEQAAELREQILLKNEFFFHQYRPQNETYIRGFRDHEQGRHVEDLPKFDPLIEEREAKIEQLRQPRTHTYQLTPVN